MADRPVGEFALIDAYFRNAGTQTAALAHPQALGIGDDAAILAPVPSGHQVVMTTDTLVEGRHYWPDVDPQALGHKVLAVSLSDLAAMGAMPWAFTLSVSLRAVRPDWMAAFMRGLSQLAERHKIDLVGGDTVGLGPQSSAPESFAVTALGLVPAGAAIRRDGLQPGDALWVSGDLGDGQWAVARRIFAQKLLWPEPRLALGQALRGVAHAAIDISDGLSSELGHLIAASARLEGRRLQARVSLPSLLGCLGETLQAQVSGRQVPGGEACRIAAESGDEYELLFAAPEEASSLVTATAARLGLQVTRIGQVFEPPGTGPFASIAGVVWCDESGRPVPTDQAPRRGFDHFDRASTAP